MRTLWMEQTPGQLERSSGQGPQVSLGRAS